MQTIPATPLTRQPGGVPGSVEESRAKRREQQQSRFRNRGGIFVPTERNDLADLLLGRSKRKSIHARPVSSSPTRAVSAKRNRKSVSAKTSVLEKRQEKSLASPATGDATDEAAASNSPAKQEPTKSTVSQKPSNTKKRKVAATPKPKEIASKPKGRSQKTKSHETTEQGVIHAVKPSSSRTRNKNMKSKDSRPTPRLADGEGDETEIAVASTSKKSIQKHSRKNVQESEDDLSLLPPPKKRKTTSAVPSHSKKDATKNAGLPPIVEEDEPISRGLVIPTETAEMTPHTRRQEKGKALPESVGDVPLKPAKPRRRKEAAVATEEDQDVGTSSHSDNVPPPPPPISKKKKRSHDVEVTDDPPLAKRVKGKLTSTNDQEDGPKPEPRKVAAEKKAVKRGKNTAPVSQETQVKKLKENARGKTRASRGPRKSVLDRSQQAVHDLDDEPDPIDFLS